MSFLDKIRQVARATMDEASFAFADIVGQAEQRTRAIHTPEAGIIPKNVARNTLLAVGGAGLVTAGAGVAILKSRKTKKAKKATKKAPKTVKTKQKKKAKKSKASKKGKSKGSHRKMEPHKHKGHSDTKHKRQSGELVHFTKKGQPYVIDDKTKRPRFIKKSEVK